ncbi:hypothetical protein CDD83_7565 [Cordyceps sp. RAO-2017]|nr:hypothetical protein CDD83_7565 [Cordyceps sp. RAO-2017]
MAFGSAVEACGREALPADAPLHLGCLAKAPALFRQGSPSPHVVAGPDVGRPMALRPWRPGTVRAAPPARGRSVGTSIYQDGARTWCGRVVVGPVCRRIPIGLLSRIARCGRLASCLAPCASASAVPAAAVPVDVSASTEEGDDDDDDAAAAAGPRAQVAAPLRAHTCRTASLSQPRGMSSRMAAGPPRPAPLRPPPPAGRIGRGRWIRPCTAVLPRARPGRQAATSYCAGTATIPRPPPSPLPHPPSLALTRPPPLSLSGLGHAPAPLRRPGDEAPRTRADAGPLRLPGKGTMTAAAEQGRPSARQPPDDDAPGPGCLLRREPASGHATSPSWPACEPAVQTRRARAGGEES